MIRNGYENPQCDVYSKSRIGMKFKKYSVYVEIYLNILEISENFHYTKNFSCLYLIVIVLEVLVAVRSDCKQMVYQ